MKIFLRNIDEELARRLSELARREHVSLNGAALVLMRRGAGLMDSSRTSVVVGSALDRFIGRWSTADEKRFLDRIAAFEAIDT
jgi:hypothetical protein